MPSFCANERPPSTRRIAIVTNRTVMSGPQSQHEKPPTCGKSKIQNPKLVGPLRHFRDHAAFHVGERRIEGAAGGEPQGIRAAEIRKVVGVTFMKRNEPVSVMMAVIRQSAMALSKGACSSRRSANASSPVAEAFALTTRIWPNDPSER